VWYALRAPSASHTLWAAEIETRAPAFVEGVGEVFRKGSRFGDNSLIWVLSVLMAWLPRFLDIRRGSVI
jgi:hypothetical protein